MSKNVTRKSFIAGLAASAATLAGCARNTNLFGSATTEATTTEAAPKVDLTEFEALAFDMDAWHYDAQNNVWYQLGCEYCTKPATATYEQLAIYVPGAYLTPKDEDTKLEKASPSDTFACELATEASVGAFTAETAPIVMPINAPEYSAQLPASSYLYDGLGDYLDAGFVYVYAGFRGRSNGYDNTATTGDGFFLGGAPWAVTELKAAVRYLRYNAGVLPGNTDRIISFGMGSGGLLASVLGTSGSSELYDTYLLEIGAATHDAEGNNFGDEIAGVMAWCPDSAPAHADAAYEWELGQFAAGEGSRAEGTWTKQLSDNLCEKYASYVNDLLLYHKDEQLALEATDGGLWTDGSYYEYLLSLLETSAKDFLSTAKFPLTVGGVDETTGYFPGSGKTVDDQAASAGEANLDYEADAAETEATEDAVAEATGGAEAGEGEKGNTAATSAPSDAEISVDPPTEDPVTSEDTDPPNNALTFASRADYINTLNSNFRWFTYNDSRKTVRIAGLSSFISEYRYPTVACPGFDTPERSALTNQLFGDKDDDSLHFSQDVADLIDENADVYVQAEGFSDDYATDWISDLRRTDTVGYSIEQRRNMYDPLFFVGNGSDGTGTTAVAPHWRINMGLAQTSTPFTPTINMALALKASENVEDVAFTSVWAAPRSLAEPAGVSAPTAFAEWVTSLYTE